jgi:hypothetical protein
VNGLDVDTSLADRFGGNLEAELASSIMPEHIEALASDII